MRWIFNFIYSSLKLNKSVGYAEIDTHVEVLGVGTSLNINEFFIIILLVAVVFVMWIILLEREVRKRMVGFSKINSELSAVNDNLEKIVSMKTKELNNRLMELKSKKKTLQEKKKLTALNKMLIGLAHELNTPFGNLLVSNDHLIKISDRIMEKDEITRSTFVEYLNDVDESLRNIAITINESEELLYRIKRIDYRMDSETIQEFNLNRLIPYLMELIKEDKNYDVNISYDIPEHVYFRIQYKPLLFILEELIDNSYTHSFQEEDNKIIEVKVIDHDEEVILLYSDRGKNIELKENVFIPFYTTVRTSGKLGLGLFMVQNIIGEYFSGSITLESEGERVYYRIILPRWS